MERYLTVADAARMLGLSHNRVKQLIETGKLKLRTKQVLAESEVEAFGKLERKPGRPRKKRRRKATEEPGS